MKINNLHDHKFNYFTSKSQTLSRLPCISTKLPIAEERNSCNILSVRQLQRFDILLFLKTEISGKNLSYDVKLVI